MKRHIIIFGITAGLVVSVMVYLSYTASLMKYEYGEMVGYTTMIIAFSTIFFAVKKHRDESLGGRIDFGTAFKMGLGITLVASMIYTATWMIMLQTVAKDFMAEYYQQSIEQVRASGIGEEEVAAKLAEMESFKELYKNPLVQIGVTFLEIFPVGLIISLITAFILKRKGARV